MRKENISNIITVLCYLQFALMLVLLYANYSISERTVSLRSQVSTMKEKVQVAQNENRRLQQEKAAIYQGLVFYRCK